ncbi:GNAT family N-acetyltransferase [Actinosynnema sp. NPDC023587]|uniref:GNAT family N-acetyltransferase n=1 Tax=Actinosynnema sp. NPDC023587 TaxID=3154695 RepID=UPI0034106253
MTDPDIRVLDDAHFRTASTLFRDTLHARPPTDEEWKTVRATYQDGQALGAFAGDEMVGTVQCFPSSLAVPGGAVVPMSAVSRVGVRADWTRRGVLTALQRVQLRAMRDAGDVASSLRASESAIYGRFGYGVATRYREVRIKRRETRSRVPVEGRVRLVDAERALPLCRALFDRLSPERPGTIGRWPGWWTLMVQRVLKEDNLKFAVASGPAGDDGFVIYQVAEGSFEIGRERPTVLTVRDLWAETPRAWADLWRFLLGVDLVHEVAAEGRPLDEPVEWLLTDRRALRSVEGDETWLRLLDVEAALAARTYRAGEPVVVGVRDRFLPENDGAYRITPAGASRTSDEPDFVVDVDVLAAAYLGDVSFAALAITGHLTSDSADAPGRADALFAVDRAPWCGTFF